jgi:hypothetical protein
LNLSCFAEALDSRLSGLGSIKLGGGEHYQPNNQYHHGISAGSPSHRRPDHVNSKLTILFFKAKLETLCDADVGMCLLKFELMFIFKFPRSIPSNYNTLFSFFLCTQFCHLSVSISHIISFI